MDSNIRAESSGHPILVSKEQLRDAQGTGLWTPSEEDLEELQRLARSPPEHSCDERGKGETQEELDAVIFNLEAVVVQTYDQFLAEEAAGERGDHRPPEDEAPAKRARIEHRASQVSRELPWSTTAVHRFATDRRYRRPVTITRRRHPRRSGSGWTSPSDQDFLAWEACLPIHSLRSSPSRCSSPRSSRTRPSRSA